MDQNQSSPENDIILENLFNMLSPTEEEEPTEGNTSVAGNTHILQQNINTHSSEQVSNTNIGQFSDLNQVYTHWSLEIDHRFQQMHSTMYNFIQCEVSRQLGSQNPGPSRVESAPETHSCSSRKRKRHRSFMSDEQHERLQSEFAKSPHPTPQPWKKWDWKLIWTMKG